MNSNLQKILFKFLIRTTIILLLVVVDSNIIINLDDLSNFTKKRNSHLISIKHNIKNKLSYHSSSSSTTTSIVTIVLVHII